MSTRGLPPEIETLIERVIRSSRLSLQDRYEVARELRAHFEDGLDRGVTASELVRRFGDPDEAARRIARARGRRSGGNAPGRGRWWMSATEWWREVTRAVRRLARAPGFAGMVVLTLALGIGANTAIFTVLDAALLEPLPYAEPDRLVRVYETPETAPGDFNYLRGVTVRAYREWNAVFERFGALYTYRAMGADLTGASGTRRVTVVPVVAGYFETLGVPPLRGRTFREEESDGPGEGSGRAPMVRVAVLSHSLWADAFGQDDEIVGRTVHLDDEAFEVVGVMPAGFASPFGARADLWVPQDIRPGGRNSFGNFYLSGVARLSEGLTLEGARERLDALYDRFQEENPDAGSWRPRLVPLHSDVVGSTRATMLWILAAAAGLVLLTACVNIANLVFARGLGRDRDVALRRALGSGRGRLVATVLMENVVLAVVGGGAGLGLGWVGVRGLTALAPDALPAVARPEVGLSVFLFALAATGAALLLFGLAPTLRLARTAPAEILRSGDRAATTGRSARRIRNGLVVGQVAMALTLVAGALLLTRSFGSLLNVPLGFETEGVLTFEVHLPEARYPDGAARHAFHERLQQSVAAWPEVEATGATSWLPVSGRYHSWGVYFDPEAPDGSNDDAWYTSDIRIVTGDYFGTLGVDVLYGTHPRDVDLDGELVAWVNRSFVDEVMGDFEPVGQLIWVAGGVRRVVGVVEDIPYDARGSISRKVYVPHAQYADDRNWALIQTVRGRGHPGALAERIRAELAEIDARLVLYRPRPLESVVETARAQDRFATVLMGVFAMLALVLSLVGTYGTLASTVAGRTREIGIRMALGADRHSVRGMVLGHATRLLVPGIALGLLGAWAGSRWIESLLFRAEPVDPIAYGLAVLIFVGGGILAGWIPARRATRVDAVRMLTTE